MKVIVYISVNLLQRFQYQPLNICMEGHSDTQTQLLGVLWLSIVVREYHAKAEWGRLSLVPEWHARLWVGFSAETISWLVY